MRALIGVVLLCAAALAHGDDFQTAVIVEAGTTVQSSGAVVQTFGDFSTVGEDTDNVNLVVLRLGTLQITSEYKTILKGSRAASNLIVGDTVQARADGKWVYFVMPGTGKTIKAKIMRQQRI